MSWTTPRTRTRRLAGVITAVVLGVAGVAAPATPAAAHSDKPARYVALGDSFASGEGLPPYEPGTDTAVNQCHRSAAQSYPELLEDRRLPRFDRLTSVACSGALTAALVANVPDRSDEPAQVAALTERTRTVTVTVGGNDIGFAPVLVDCIYSPVQVPDVQQLIPGRPGCQQRLDAGVSARIALLAGPAGDGSAAPLSIAGVIAAIHERAPKARIYVSGYPELLGTRVTSPAGCLVGQLGQVPLFITAADASWIRAKVADLNAAIRTGVARAQAAGVRARYVEVADDFAGHNVCDTGERWVNGVVFAPVTPPRFDVSTFHPNASGQVAYADAFATAVRGRAG